MSLIPLLLLATLTTILWVKILKSPLNPKNHSQRTNPHLNKKTQKTIIFNNKKIEFEVVFQNKEHWKTQVRLHKNHGLEMIENPKETYTLHLWSNHPLTQHERKNLHRYLLQEGYIEEAEKNHQDPQT
jgi:hypothetical protein